MFICWHDLMIKKYIFSPLSSITSNQKETPHFWKLTLSFLCSICGFRLLNSWISPLADIITSGNNKNKSSNVKRNNLMMIRLNKESNYSLLSLWVLYWDRSCRRSSLTASGQRAATSLMALRLKHTKTLKFTIKLYNTEAVATWTLHTLTGNFIQPIYSTSPWWKYIISQLHLLTYWDLSHTNTSSRTKHKLQRVTHPTVMTSPEFLSVTKLLAMVMIKGSVTCRCQRTNSVKLLC